MRSAVMLLTLMGLANLAQARHYRNDPWVREHCLISSRGMRLAASSSSAQLLDSYEKQAAGKPLVIFIHGGLVAEDVGIEIAKNDLARQAFKAQDCYPIFFIWKSEWDKELDSQRSLSPNDDLNQPAPDVDDRIGLGAGDFERFGYQSIEWLAHTPGALLWQHMKRDISDAFSPTGAGTEFAKELVKRHIGRIVLVGHSAGSLWIMKLLEAVRRISAPDAPQFDVILLAPAATYDFIADKLQAWNKVGYQPIRTFHMHILSDSAERRNGVFGDANFKEQFRTGLSGLQSYIGDIAPRFGGMLDNLGLNSYPGSLLFLVSLFEYPDIWKYPPPHAPLLGMQYYLDPISRMAGGDPIDRIQHVWVNQYLLDGPGTIQIWPLSNGLGPRIHSDFLHDPNIAAQVASLIKQFNEDRDWRDNPHVIAGSIATGFTAECSPPRHLSVLAQPGILNVGLDHTTVALLGGHELQAQASVTLSGPNNWLNGAHSVDVSFEDALRLTPGADVEINVSLDGASTGPMRLTTGTMPTFHFNASNGFANPMTVSVDIRASRANASDWCALTLHSMKITRTD